MKPSPRNDLTKTGVRAKRRIAGKAANWTSMLGIPVERYAVETSPQLTWIVGFFKWDDRTYWRLDAALKIVAKGEKEDRAPEAA
jgi:hypothetical protein